MFNTMPVFSAKRIRTHELYFTIEGQGLITLILIPIKNGESQLYIKISQARKFSTLISL